MDQLASEFRTFAQPTGSLSKNRTPETLEEATDTAALARRQGSHHRQQRTSSPVRQKGQHRLRIGHRSRRARHRGNATHPDRPRQIRSRRFFQTHIQLHRTTVIPSSQHPFKLSQLIERGHIAT